MSLSRVWFVLYGEAGEAFFKRGTGQTGQEPETHIHTLSDWCTNHTALKTTLFVWHNINSVSQLR